MMKIIKIKYSVALAFLAVMAVSCEKDLAISEDSIVTEFFKTGDDISRIYLKPGGSGNNSGGYMDFRTGKLYTSGQMTEHYHDVDLAYTYGVSSGNNLLTMDAQNVSFTDVGEEVEHVFPYKNKGELYRYADATDDDVKWFLSLSTAADVRRGYDSVLNVLAQRGGNDAQAAKRLGNLQRGEIILLHGINRKVKSLIYIESIASSANGTMNMLIKSDMGEQVYFQKPNLPFNNPALRADTLVLEVQAPNTDENYIDLLRRKVYKDVELENDDVSQITLLHTHGVQGSGNSPITMFFTLSNSTTHLPKYNVGLTNWLNTLPNRRVIYLLRLDTRSEYVPGYTFEDVRHNNEALRDYSVNYIKNVGSWASRIPSSDGATAAAGMVFRIRDVDNDLWGLMKVLSVDNSTGTCKVALKYAQSE